MEEFRFRSRSHGAHRANPTGLAACVRDARPTETSWQRDHTPLNAAGGVRHASALPARGKRHGRPAGDLEALPRSSGGDGTNPLLSVMMISQETIFAGRPWPLQATVHHEIATVHHEMRCTTVTVIEEDKQSASEENGPLVGRRRLRLVYLRGAPVP
jgi:hypothetical protein